MVSWCQAERFKAVAVCAAELGRTSRGRKGYLHFSFGVKHIVHMLCVCVVSSQLDDMGEPQIL